MINKMYLIRLAQLIEVFYFVCVCEWYICECAICMWRYVCLCLHMEANERCQRPYSSLLCLIPFRQVLSHDLELGWWPASSCDPPVPSHLKAGIAGICVWPCLTFHMSAGIWTQVPTVTQQAFTDWATIPTLIEYYKYSLEILCMA